MDSNTIEARFQVKRGEFELKTDFTAPAHGVTALFGESGSGKTTLLRAVAGLEKNPGGYLRIGASIWQDGHQFVAVFWREVVGSLSEMRTSLNRTSKIPYAG